MSAATTPINTPEASGSFVSVPLLNGAVLYAGALLAITAAGYGVPASNTAGLRVIGRVESTTTQSIFDNTSGAAGAITVTVRRGVFVLNNSTASPVTAANIGGNVMAEDDNTVATAASKNLIAGLCLGFFNNDPTQVIVDTTSAAVAASA